MVIHEFNLTLACTIRTNSDNTNKLNEKCNRIGNQMQLNKVQMAQNEYSFDN